jgi:hypothetical protein
VFRPRKLASASAERLRPCKTGHRHLKVPASPKLGAAAGPGQPREGLIGGCFALKPPANCVGGAIAFRYVGNPVSGEAAASKRKSAEMAQLPDSPQPLSPLSVPVDCGAISQMKSGGTGRVRYNLAAKLPDKVKELHARLAAWREAIKAPMPTTNTEQGQSAATKQGRKGKKRQQQKRGQSDE